MDAENSKYVFKSEAYAQQGPSRGPAWEWVKKNPQLHTWIDGKYSEIIENNRHELEVEGSTRVAAAVSSSLIAQARWVSYLPETRQDIMYRLIAVFQGRRKFISQLCSMSEEDHDVMLEFFSFSCDLSIDKWEPVGVVLVKLSTETPPWVVTMNVTSALSAGCSVIINPCPKSCHFAFTIAEICDEAGFPKGMVNILPGRLKTYQEFLKMDIQKIIYNGNLRPEDFLGHKMPPHVAVLTPNHTTMVVLESGDVESAVDKFLSETWSKYSETVFAVDSLIVQESVYRKFLSTLVKKLKHFPINFADDTKLMDTLVRIVRGGAKVVTSSYQVRRLVPIIFSQHHLDFGELPIVTMMKVRTVDEAINLANSSNYSIGTSIWTEDYPEALTMTSELESSIVWINCHGLMDATITFEPARKSGLGCFGGLEGILENRTTKPLAVGHEIDCVKYPETDLYSSDLFDTVQSAFNAFMTWKKDKERKKYLKDIAAAMKTENLTNYVSDLNVWANMGNSYELLKGSKIPETQILQNKRPIGIIVMVLMDSEDAFECFTSYVSPAIAFGNVIIAVMNANTASTLNTLLDCYSRNLPAGVLNVVQNIDYASILATDMNVQAISVCTDRQEIGNEVQKLKKIAVLNFKRFWVQPSIERSMSEYPRRFLKEQTTFMPNVQIPDIRT